MFPTDETVRADTGLPGRPLAVEQAGPRARHLPVLLAQLWGPFRPLDPNGDRPIRPEPGTSARLPRGRVGMTAADHGRSGGRVRAVASAVLRTDPSAAGTEVAALAVRIALVWIFFYYGAGKLFGAFDGPGIHRTAEFMADTAHLRPGAFFAVLGGVIEFGGALALAFGLVTRLAGLALLGDQVVAMVTVCGCTASTPCPRRPATSSTSPSRPWPSSSSASGRADSASMPSSLGT